MEWQYQYPANEAVHIATRAKFKIAFASGSNSFFITPVDPTAKLPKAEQSRLIEALSQYVGQEILRGELRNLIATKCGNDLADAARAISLVADRAVTTRTIQSWLIEPGRPSSRNCPEWAVSALREKETPLYDSVRVEPKPFHVDPDAWVNEVRVRKGVLIATEKIEQEERRRVKWKKTPAADFPLAIADLETQLWGWIHALEARQHAIRTALQNASSFDEFKNKTLEMFEAISTVNYEVQEARREIETYSVKEKQ